jgi:hypothetical protein
MMLGEAYLRIQEPGKAIAAFQEALKVGHRCHLVPSVSCPLMFWPSLPVLDSPVFLLSREDRVHLLGLSNRNQESSRRLKIGRQLLLLLLPFLFQLAASCFPCFILPQKRRYAHAIGNESHRVLPRPRKPPGFRCGFRCGPHLDMAFDMVSDLVFDMASDMLSGMVSDMLSNMVLDMVPIWLLIRYLIWFLPGACLVANLAISEHRTGRSSLKKFLASMFRESAVPGKV